MKKTPVERSYLSALCRIIVLLQFRLSEQGAIKLMRRLLNHVFESVLTEKDLVKELKRTSKRLKRLDKHPDEELSQDEANLIFGRLELEFNLDVEVAVLQTPAPCSTRPTSSRRRVRCDETSFDEEDPPTSVQSVFPSNSGSISTQSQRASKTAALSKLTATIIPPKIDEVEESSEVTSEEDSDESDQFAE